MHGRSYRGRRNSAKSPSLAVRGKIRYLYGDELIPSFDSRDEMSNYASSQLLSVPSNPEIPGLNHAVTFLVNYSQVYQYLIKPRENLKRRDQMKQKEEMGLRKLWRDNPLRNREDEKFAKIAEQVDQRLDVPFHVDMPLDQAVMNTLNYMMFHMKCGIYVKIANNRLEMFAPFTNRDYENNWAKYLHVFDPEKMSEYVDSKADVLREPEKYLPIDKWWANGNIICNVEGDNIWNDHLVVQMRDMIISVCASREVNDVEFFINKRDYPHLKKNCTEPYDFIFDMKDVPLTRYKYDHYAPIVSFFCGPEFADIPFPSADDWEIATGKVFPPRGNDIYAAANRAKFQVEWKDKIATAFFRGSATGGGVTTETNQRLKLASISNAWSKDSRYNEENNIDKCRFLDAGITSWNLRDKKLYKSEMTFLNPKKIGFERANRVDMFQQSKYKYIIYVEGHCAAARYAFLMSVGCVILKVESKCSAPDLWKFPALEPFVDHIPVDGDLSDIAEKIEWCKTHDNECMRIAETSKKLYDKYFGKESILDYAQYVLNTISSHYIEKDKILKENSSDISTPTKKQKSDSVSEIKEDSTVQTRSFSSFQTLACVPFVVNLNDLEAMEVDDIFKKLNFGWEIVSLSGDNMSSLKKNDYFACNLPLGSCCFLIINKSNVYLRDFWSSERRIIRGAEFLFRKNSEPVIKQTVCIAYISSVEPLHIVIHDVLMIFGTVLKREKLSHRLKVAKVELQSIRCKDGTSITCETASFHDLNSLQNSRSELASRNGLSRGLCFVKDLPFGENSPRRYIIHEWHGVLNASSASSDLFDEQDNLDYANSFAESPLFNPYRILSATDYDPNEHNWRLETKKLSFIHLYNKSFLSFDKLVEHLSSS